MKQILSIVPAQKSHWVGTGFSVHPLFGQLAFTNTLSPFLLFDYGAPRRFEPTSERRGVGRHPHRGFETVTVAFGGEVEHQDSHRNHGIIGTGDVQWMTAGSGIIHEEFHSVNFAKTGGIMEMIQLWVNLPAKDKFTAPKYQSILSRDIPEIPLADGAGSVRIIAGEYNGVRGPASTFTPINVWDVSMNAESSAEFEIPADHNSMLVIREGSLTHRDGDEITSDLPVHQLVVFQPNTSNSILSLQTKDKHTKWILLTGLPLNEPIAHQGPFSLNTEEEVQQAIIDYETGNFIRD